MSECCNLQSGEVRVIKIGHEATLELIWEALMVYGKGSFGLSDQDEDSIYVMKYNEVTQNTTFVVCKLKDRNKVDIDAIELSTDITASSMFDDSPYVVKFLSEDNGSGN